MTFYISFLSTWLIKDREKLFAEADV
ncbi:hypothetical protein OIU78_014016, partial [Salix suchowensis]